MAPADVAEALSLVEGIKGVFAGRLHGVAPVGFNATATSYGRASWPATVFFDERGDKLPVIPWFSNFSCTDPSAPPL